jgi:hypothetical protein
MPHKNLEERHAYFRRYYELHGQQLRDRERLRYLSKRNEIIAKTNEYRKNNAAVIKDRKRRYHLAHAPEILQKVMKWAKEHPERHREIQSRARSKRHRLNPRPDNSLSANDWTSILEKWNHRCVYCGSSDVPLTQDHYIPLIKGGQHTADNVVPACLTCNCRKRDRHPHLLF